MVPRSRERSIPELLAALFDRVPTLVRKESQLARAELSEKLTSMGRGVGFVAVGAILLIPALVVLLVAAVAALERAGLAPSIAALIVGGSTLLVGVIALMIGVNRMRVSNLAPERTIHQLQEDASIVKRQARTDHEYQRAA